MRTGLTAEAAVQRVQNDTRARMLAPDRPAMPRERLHDLDDLSNRLLRHAVGRRRHRGDGARCRTTPS